MSNENDRTNEVDNLESLIDRALESYTPEAQRAGLEQRILASFLPRPRSWNWRLTWALSVAILLLTATAIPLWLRYSQPRNLLVRRAPSSQMEYSSRTTFVFASPAKKMRRAPAPIQPAPLPQFGQPRATQEELILARFAVQNPEALSALDKAKPAIDTPISIPPISYNPIAVQPVEIPPISVAPIQISSLNSAN